MRGLITKKDIFLHPLIIIQSFGLPLFLQAAFSPPKKTFLEIISKNIPKPKSKQEIEITAQVERFISLEEGVSKIYSNLMTTFQVIPEARKFFQTLAYHEQAHAEILKIVKIEAARRNLWDQVKPIKEELLNQVQIIIDKLLFSTETDRNIDLKRGIEIVELIEKTENKVILDFLLHFYRVVQTPFLKKIHHIIPSFANHHEYLNTTMPEIKEALSLAQRSNNRHKNR